MGLRDINIKLEYRGFQDEIVRDFYIPLLEESCLYQRAVGFFSSTSLAEIAKGKVKAEKPGLNSLLRSTGS